MNIGFDGKRAANNLTGLGNYSRSLIAHMISYFPQNQYFIYTPKVKPHKQIQSFTDLPGVLLKLAKFPVLWRSLRILIQLKKDRIDLYHGLSQELPLLISTTGIKAVVTIHDLIYLRFPAYYPYIDRQIYALKARAACRQANGIIAISENTKRDLVEQLHVPASKIRVIYQSCDDSFNQSFSFDRQLEIRHKYNLPKKYLLNVGTIEPRKNLMLIVQALKEVPSAVSLVVIGKAQAYATAVKQEIERLGLINRVIFLQDVSFTDLPVIYKMASVFVYPSFYEGFGIPIIEALNARVPVIAATGSCLEEAGGPDSIYIDPNNKEQLAAALQEVLFNDERRRIMIERGLEFVQRFDKVKIAQDLDRYYKEIAAL